MDSPVVGAILAFLGGTAVSAVNFAINLRTLRKSPASLATVSILRQALNVAYLVAVFFLCRVLPWGHVPLLLGAALGLTIPAMLFAVLLARINDRQKAEQTDPDPKEGDACDG